MEDDIFGKRNVYGARTSDKRYLAKKKRQKEKNALPGGKEMSEERFLPDSSDDRHWRVAEIRQGVSHRTIECISPEAQEPRAVELPFSSPFFDQIVIGDYVTIEDG